MLPGAFLTPKLRVGSSEPRKRRDGKNSVGRQPALFVSVSLSLLSQIRLETFVSREGGRTSPPLRGVCSRQEYFPSTEPACPPAPRQPCLASNTSSTPRDFLGRHQLGPNPISLRRRGTFLGGPTSFPHLLPPPWGAAMRAEGERLKPLTTAVSEGLPAGWDTGFSRRGDGWRDPRRAQGLPEDAGPQCFPDGDMDGRTSEGRSGACPVKEPRRAGRGAALPQRAWMEGPQRAQGIPKGAGTALPQGAARPATTPEPSALTCGVAIAAIAPPGPALFKLGGPGAAASALSRGRPGGAAGGRPSGAGQGAGAALPHTAPGQPPLQPPAEVVPPPPALRGERGSREAAGRSERRYRTAPGEGAVKGQCHRGCGPVPEGGDGRHGGGSVPLEALSRNARGWPRPGPLCWGHRCFPVSVLPGARDRRSFPAEPAECSSPWERSPAPIPATGRCLHSAGLRGSFPLQSCPFTRRI